jgi:hypothetical protein
MWMRQSMRRARAGRDTGASVEQDDRLIGAERFPRRGDDELSD